MTVSVKTEDADERRHRRELATAINALSNQLTTLAASVGSGSLTSVVALASAITNLAAGNTDITGCSVSLTAGTWLIIAVANIVNIGATNTAYLRLYNFTDTVDLTAEAVSLTGGGFVTEITMSKVLTVAATKTIRMSGKQPSGGTFQVYQFGDGTIPGTYINAIKIA